ncbi:MAG: hypothetical protein EBR67_08915 [Proteobacteria bacterium]|nr:hypothetical protein [Pseudomonadota bacterium]
MLNPNITATNSVLTWENKLRISLEETGFGEKEQGKIIANIARELQKNGKLTKPIEEKDIFEAAKMTYKFNSTSNTILSAAIDGLNGNINIKHSPDKDSPDKDSQWISKGANPILPDCLTDERGRHPDLSLKMVKSSIEEIKKANPQFTIDEIIEDLKDRKIIQDRNDGRPHISNKHLHDTLVAMKQQGVTQEEIEKAIKSDEEWNDLIRKVKKTEFQRHVIQDSIWRIKKANPQFTIDDIIKDLQSVNNSAELRNNLRAMKKQAVTREEIETAIKSDEGWNKLIKEKEEWNKLIKEKGIIVA